MHRWVRQPPRMPGTAHQVSPCTAPGPRSRYVITKRRFPGMKSKTLSAGRWACGTSHDPGLLPFKSLCGGSDPSPPFEVSASQPERHTAQTGWGRNSAKLCPPPQDWRKRRGGVLLGCRDWGGGVPTGGSEAHGLARLLLTRCAAHPTGAPPRIRYLFWCSVSICSVATSGFLIVSEHGNDWEDVGVKVSLASNN